MVSTRNTSRSNTNPTRMPDPPGDADSRPPGPAEAIQANTDEVEALRLVKPALDRGDRTTHQTNATPPRRTSDSGRPQRSSTRGTTRLWYTPKYRSRGGIQSSQMTQPTTSPRRGRKPGGYTEDAVRAWSHIALHR